MRGPTNQDDLVHVPVRSHQPSPCLTLVLLTRIRRPEILFKLERLSWKLVQILQMRIHQPRILGLLRAVDEIRDRAEQRLGFRLAYES